MKLKMPHPRVLFMLLLLIGALASTAILLADDPEEFPTEFEPLRTAPTPTPLTEQETDDPEEFPTEFSPLRTAPTPTPLTEQEKEDAISIVTASGVVKSISGGQEWKPEQIYRAKLAGTEGIRLDAVWANPVESAGPWSLMFCSGTRQSYTSLLWHDVTRLVVWVDMESRSVAGFGVTSEPEDDTQPHLEPISPGEPVKIYDAKSRDIIYEGSLSDGPTRVSEFCEEGTYYAD